MSLIQKLIISKISWMKILTTKNIIIANVVIRFNFLIRITDTVQKEAVVNKIFK